jgi:hypothetical protein
MQFFSSRQAYDRSFRTVRLKKPLQPSQLQHTTNQRYATPPLVRFSAIVRILES